MSLLGDLTKEELRNEIFRRNSLGIVGCVSEKEVEIFWKPGSDLLRTLGLVVHGRETAIHCFDKGQISMARGLDESGEGKEEEKEIVDIEFFQEGILVREWGERVKEGFLMTAKEVFGKIWTGDVNVQVLFKGSAISCVGLFSLAGHALMDAHSRICDVLEGAVEVVEDCDLIHGGEGELLCAIQGLSGGEKSFRFFSKANMGLVGLGLTELVSELMLRKLRG